MKARITTKMLDSLTPERFRREDLIDEACAGLRARVTSAGVVTFSFVYNLKGERKRTNMGRYPKLSLADARAKADTWRSLVGQGIEPKADEAGTPAPMTASPVAFASPPSVANPVPAAVLTAGEVTFGKMCDKYLEDQAKVLRRSTHREYERKIRNVLKPLYGHRTPESMTVAEMREWEEALATKAPVDANRTHSLMARVFKVGIRKGLTQWTPYAALEKPTAREKARERVLEDKEIVAIFQALRHERPVIAGLWEVLFWTGLRESYPMRAAWADIRFDAKDWHFPVTKKARGNTEGTGSPYLLPMTEPVVEVQFLRRVSPDSAWVFPGASPRHLTREKDHPIANVARSIDRLRDATGIDFQMRDIRRTISTKMAELHVPVEYISRVLDHTIPGEAKVTQVHYLMYRFRQEKLYALTVWARQLMELVGKYRRWDSKAPMLIAVPAPPKPELEDLTAPPKKRRGGASVVREASAEWPVSAGS